MLDGEVDHFLECIVPELIVFNFVKVFDVLDSMKFGVVHDQFHGRKLVILFLELVQLMEDGFLVDSIKG